MGRQSKKEAKRPKTEVELRALAARLLNTKRSCVRRYVDLVRFNVAIALAENPRTEVDKIIVEVPRRLWRSLPLMVTTEMLLEIVREGAANVAFPYPDVLLEHLRALRKRDGRGTMSPRLIRSRLFKPANDKIHRNVAIIADIALRGQFTKPGITSIIDFVDRSTKNREYLVYENLVLNIRTRTVSKYMSSIGMRILSPIFHSKILAKEPILDLSNIIDYKSHSHMIVTKMDDFHHIVNIIRTIDVKTVRLASFFDDLVPLGKTNSDCESYQPAPLPDVLAANVV